MRSQQYAKGIINKIEFEQFFLYSFRRNLGDSGIVLVKFLSTPLVTVIAYWNACLCFVRCQLSMLTSKIKNRLFQKPVIFFLYFFCAEREPALLRELRKDKIPTRSFLWPTQIWLPTNWVVRRNFQGQSEIVPTVLSKQVTSITTPRSDPSQPVSKTRQPVS